MPKVINTITDAQRAQFPKQVEKWTKIGLSTEFFDHKRGIENALKCYDAANLKRPSRVVIARSPQALVYACPMVDCFGDDLKKGDGLSGKEPIFTREGFKRKRGKLETMLSDTLWGDAVGDGAPHLNRVIDTVKLRVPQSDIDRELKDVGEWARKSSYNLTLGQFYASFVSFVDAFETILGWEHECLQKFHLDRNLTESVGFVWWGENCVGICDRPVKFRRNNVGRLHADDGAAIEYSDGFGLCAWHGYVIPENKEWIIRDKSKITADEIEKEGNAEIRRIMLENHGFDRYMSERNAKMISEDVDGNGFPRRLMELTVRGEKINVVEVLNGSLEPDGTRRKFILGAARHPTSGSNPRTPKEAIAWSYGIPEKAFNEGART